MTNNIKQFEKSVENFNRKFVDDVVHWLFSDTLASKCFDDLIHSLKYFLEATRGELETTKFGRKNKQLLRLKNVCVDITQFAFENLPFELQSSIKVFGETHYALLRCLDFGNDTNWCHFNRCVDDILIDYKLLREKYGEKFRRDIPYVLQEFKKLMLENPLAIISEIYEPQFKKLMLENPLAITSEVYEPRREGDTSISGDFIYSLCRVISRLHVIADHPLFEEYLYL